MDNAQAADSRSNGIKGKTRNSENRKMPHDKSPTDAPPLQPLAAVEDVFHDISRIEGKKFIVVASDDDVAQTVNEWLKIMGCEAECFRSAEDALLHTNVQLADYFIVDRSPEGSIDGNQLLNMLRLKRGQAISAVLIDTDASDAADLQWPVHTLPLSMPGLISTLVSQTDPG